MGLVEYIALAVIFFFGVFSFAYCLGFFLIKRLEKADPYVIRDVSLAQYTPEQYLSEAKNAPVMTPTSPTPVTTPTTLTRDHEPEPVLEFVRVQACIPSDVVIDDDKTPTEDSYSASDLAELYEVKPKPTSKGPF